MGRNLFYMKKLYFLVVILFVVGSVRGQIVEFEDANLKAYLLASDTFNFIAHDADNMPITIDANSDGEIQITEALEVHHLKIEQIQVANLSGLEMFSNLHTLSFFQANIVFVDVSSITSLKILSCMTCENLTNLNVGNISLEKLELRNVPISSLDLTGANTLNELVLVFVPITSLDLSNQPLLTYINCNITQLTALDFSNNSLLKNINLFNNQFTSVNVSNCPLLEILNVSFNNLTSLDVSSNIALKRLDCGKNSLTMLDVSNNTQMEYLLIEQNPFEHLFLKNGRYYPSLFAYITSAPEYLCVDEENIALYIMQIGSQSNVEINSYCSFIPGGTSYLINGNNTIDTNNNGCDASNASLPNLKLNITNDTQAGSLISDESGLYTISVSEGIHTLTPVLEIPTYFNISPSTITVTFPDSVSPFIQNFCITPNGIHPDLEVAILPITPAVPGFNANYKLVIKNKGNIQQSGSVSFTYDDTVLDYVTANPVFTTQTTGSLGWDFANLEPFETREINVTLNVNSPMEAPAVNGGDVLNYTATITSNQVDDLPLDNTFTLPQIVVNSFDPNDKTCLEGTSIIPDMIGKYVHYMIRFENTGTFAAENIVVKDMIDTAKFDVSSLIALNGSHPYVTRIIGNKVEFIFESINLPFDDANNDGYVVFKIKTLPTLALGDSFSNSASIYFDYNHPIVTEPAVTTFAELGTEDFVFNSYFTLYPNPTTGILNITTKEAITMQSISIYNVLGQMVVSVPNAKDVANIDVSSLSTGNYFIKIVSDKGTSNAKFIKK